MPWELPVMLGIGALPLIYLTFAGGGRAETRRYVRSHIVHFRAMTIIVIISELFIVLAFAFGRRT